MLAARMSGTKQYCLTENRSSREWSCGIKRIKAFACLKILCSPLTPNFAAFNLLFNVARTTKKVEDEWLAPASCAGDLCHGGQPHRLSRTKAHAAHGHQKPRPLYTAVYHP